MKTLADHPDYRITLHQAGSKRSKICLVTFGGQPSDLADAGFGTEFALKNGWDTIYVAQRYGTQYQGLSVEAFKAAVAPAVRRRDPVCYGPSLGGYAALYYGGSINARIIAGAPMLPAWRPLKNRAYAALPMTHSELIDVPRSKKAPVVIYDPSMPAHRRVVDDMIRPAYPDLRAVEYLHAGDTVLVTMQNTRQLKPWITTLITEDRLIPVEPLQEGSANYHRTRGKLLRASNPAAATQELRRALEIEPSRNILAVLLGHLLKQGDLAGAQALIDEAESSGDRRLTIIPSARAALTAAGLRVSGAGAATAAPPLEPARP